MTADGVTHRLPAPFFVIATQNPIEYEGTYPLPEAQLDRFLLRTAVGYPDAQTEWEMLAQRIDRGADEVALATVVVGRRADRDAALARSRARLGERRPLRRRPRRRDARRARRSRSARARAGASRS